MTRRKSLVLLATIVLITVPLLVGCGAPDPVLDPQATFQAAYPFDERFVIRPIQIAYENKDNYEIAGILTDRETGQQYLLANDGIPPLLDKGAPAPLGAESQ